MGLSLGVQVLGNSSCGKEPLFVESSIPESSIPVLFQNECLYSQYRGLSYLSPFYLSFCCSCGSVHWILSANEIVSILMANSLVEKKAHERNDQSFKMWKKNFYQWSYLSLTRSYQQQKQKQHYSPLAAIDSWQLQFVGKYLTCKFEVSYSGEHLESWVTAGRIGSKPPNFSAARHSQTPTFRHLEVFNIKNSVSMDKTRQDLFVLVYRESGFLIKYLKSFHGLTTPGFSHTDVVFHLPLTSNFCFLMKLAWPWLESAGVILLVSEGLMTSENCIMCG